MRALSIFVYIFCLLTNFVGWSQEPSAIGLRTIVIDPGHGGHDPGCHGVNTKEKDVALAVGLKLGKYIEDTYKDVKVIYTRKTDVFVELDERAKIANRNNADLFICIHANAGPAAAHGAETYVLGLHRTEAQKDIADRENSAIHLEEDGGKKYEEFDMSPDAIIARSIQLSVFLDHSISFASKVQHQFDSLGRKNRGVKQAGFIVLYKTTMPSVLIETGFLSNKEEEKFLRNPESQKKMAGGIFTAFQQFKAEYEGVEFEYKAPPKEEKIEPEIKDDPIEKTEVVESAYTDYVFKVQVETSVDKLSKKDKRFHGYTISEYQDGGYFKYTIGKHSSFKEANAMKKDVRKKVFPNAFVVAFKDGKRVNLQKAIKLAGK